MKSIFFDSNLNSIESKNCNIDFPHICKCGKLITHSTFIYDIGTYFSEIYCQDCNSVLYKGFIIKIS